jgi:tripartite-type tricarboxylate transporter receptor subunit TctC
MVRVAGAEGNARRGPREAYQTVSDILKSPDMTARLADLGSVAGGEPPEKFAAFIAAETAKWTKVTKEAGVTME